MHYKLNNKRKRYTKINNKHLWCSGRIRAYQAREPGSIPGGCKLFFSLFIIEIHSFFWLIIHKG